MVCLALDLIQVDRCQATDYGSVAGCNDFKRCFLHIILISVGGPMIDRFCIVFRVLFAFDVKLRNL